MPAPRLRRTLLPALLCLGLLSCAHLPGARPALGVEDFTFEGENGSAGARIEQTGPGAFRVTLGHAPGHPDWPNKLNLRILRHARGNPLRLEVVFDAGSKAYAFNEYFQSYSYDRQTWTPVFWERGRDASPHADVLTFPPFTEDAVHIGTQVPMSYEEATALMKRWAERPGVTLRQIGVSLGGRSLVRVEIAATEPGRPWVHYFANQHPGEHNSQWRLVGIVDWMLSDAGAAYRRRNATHVILMMSPDAPANGWYRVGAEGEDMNRSYRAAGADATGQTHEAHLWQKDLEALMASAHPVTTVWAIHTWGGLVEPLILPGPELPGDAWMRLRDAIEAADPQDLIKPLALSREEGQYGPTTWSGGPHRQFGITAVLCEGGGALYTKEENLASGVALIRGIAAVYGAPGPGR